MIQPPEREDPLEKIAVPEEQKEVSSDDSSSEDSSDDPDSSDSVEADAFDTVAAPSSWDPDTVMYRNKKSKIVHVVAVGGAQTFSCGIRIGEDFEKISESQFLELRKCMRCAQARPLKTAGQLASALEKLHRERKGGCA